MSQRPHAYMDMQHATWLLLRATDHAIIQTSMDRPASWVLWTPSLLIGHGNFVLGLKCAVAVLELLENLSRAVQSSHSSVQSMITAMQMTADSRIIFVLTTRLKLAMTTPLCMSWGWCTTSGTTTPETPTASIFWTFGFTPVDECWRVLSQSVLPVCGQRSQPAEGQIWTTGLALVHPTRGGIVEGGDERRRTEGSCRCVVCICQVPRIACTTLKCKCKLYCDNFCKLAA